MSDNKPTIKGIEQGRASYAYKYVSEFINKVNSDDKIEKEEKKKKIKNEFASHVKKIPMLIKTNGLGNTFAFVLSKSKNKKDAYGCIYSKTQEWLFNDDKKKLVPKDKIIDNDLLPTLINIESPIYRAVTVEVLALFNWMRRFVEGMIKE